MTLFSLPKAIKDTFSLIKRMVLRDYELVPRQQRIVLVFFTLLSILQMLGNFLGWYGTKELHFILPEAGCMSGIIIVIILMHRGRVTVQGCLHTILILTQLVSIYSMVIMLANYSTHYQAACIGVILSMAFSVIIAILGFLHRFCHVLRITFLLTVLSAMLLSGDQLLLHFGIYLLVIFSSIVPMLFLLTRSALSLSVLNKTLTDEEKELLQVMRLEKQQVKAFVQLAKQQQDLNGTVNLMNILGDKAKLNVVSNVKAIMTANDTERKRMSDIFPELTPTQIAIARFIISDKSLSEISNLLNKSESNITTQRSDIRRRLGVVSGENLKEALLKRMKAYDDES